MKMFMLMVLFAVPDNPEPQILPGFNPLQMRDLEQCLMRESFMQRHFEEQGRDKNTFEIFCVEFEARGFEEAKDALKKRMGEGL